MEAVVKRPRSIAKAEPKTPWELRQEAAAREAETGMQWTQSDTIALAQQACVHCLGLGMCSSHGAKMRPCHCVERQIFRACYNRFRRCASCDVPVGRVSLESNPGRQRKNVWSLKNEEYCADFVLVSRRVLGEGTLAWRVFRYHFLLGADWKICVRKLRIPKGEFFHEVYRVEQTLGRAYREIEPHALFPLDEYFGGVSNKHERPAAMLPLQHRSLRAPLRQAELQRAA